MAKFPFLTLFAIFACEADGFGMSKPFSETNRGYQCVPIRHSGDCSRNFVNTNLPRICRARLFTNQLTASTSPLTGAVQRVAGSTILFTAMAVCGHVFITGPLPAIPLNGFAASAGIFTGLVWAVQYLIVDTGALNSAVQKSWTVLIPDSSALGRGLDSKIRSFVKELRSAPGLQGFMIRFILDASGMFNEPGVVRMVEEVERAATDGQQTSLSSLVSAAAEGALTGRLDELKVAAVAGASVLVLVGDGSLLVLDSVLHK